VRIIRALSRVTVERKQSNSMASLYNELTEAQSRISAMLSESKQIKMPCLTARLIIILRQLLGQFRKSRRFKLTFYPAWSTDQGIFVDEVIDTLLPGFSPEEIQGIFGSFYPYSNNVSEQQSDNNPSDMPQERLIGSPSSSLPPTV